MTCDPVGVADIADRLGVKRQTVALWNMKKRLPPPDWQLRSGPLWHWPRVKKWAKDAGKL